MKSDVVYEWIVEQVDEHGDIQDTYAVDSFKEAISEDVTYHRKDIAIVRERGNEDDGLLDRGYAYVIMNNYLSRSFCSGHKVPNKFIQEVENTIHD